MGDGRSPIGNLVTDESEAGEILQASLGDDKIEHTFTLRVPTATQAGDIADMDKLETFVRTTVGWAARSFFYTDSAGTSYEVNLLTNGSELEPTRRHVNVNQYSFRFREVV